MKYLIPLLLICQFSFAQSLSEVDSLLKIYEETRAFDKGIALALKTSKRYSSRDTMRGIYLERQGDFYQSKYEDDLAVKAFEKALRIVKKNKVRSASILTKMSNSHLFLGKYELAFEYCLEAKDILEEELGTEHLIYATTLNELALLYTSTGQISQALSLYFDVKRIREKNLGKQHELCAITSVSIANQYYFLAKADSAEMYYLEAKNTMDFLGKITTDYAQILNGLALTYTAKGKYDLALTKLVEAVEIQEQILGDRHPEYISGLLNLGVLHDKMGNVSMALSIYRETKKTLLDIYGEEHPEYLSILAKIAGVHYSKGNYDKALSLYLEVKAKMLTENNDTYIELLANLGGVYNKIGRYADALQLFEEGLQLIVKKYGKGHPLYAINIENMASSHNAMGNHKLAFYIYEDAKNIVYKLYGKQHADYIHMLNGLIDAKTKEGRYDQAWEYVVEILNIYESRPIKLSFEEDMREALLAYSDKSNKHIEYILHLLELCYTILDKDMTVFDREKKQVFLTEIATGLLSNQQAYMIAEEDKATLLELNHHWLRKRIQKLRQLNDREKGFSLSEQNKSIFLLQSIRNEKAYNIGGLPASIQQKESAFQERKSQLTVQIIEEEEKEKKDSLKLELNKLHQDLQLFVQELQEKYPKYHQFYYQQVETKVSEIQELLEEETAFIEYFITDTEVNIFILTKEDMSWEKVKLPFTILQKKIQQYHHSLSDFKALEEQPVKAYQQYTTQAHWFYQQLLAPVLEGKEDIAKLIIVTDRELGHLPFETFLVEAAPAQEPNYTNLSYLIKGYSVSYNYSASLWKENQLASKPQNNGELFALAANYSIKADSALSLRGDRSRRGLLKDLPSARLEVKNLQKLYTGFFLFDSLATESMVKKHAKDYAILHFATHGILNAKQPLLSSLALTEDNSEESSLLQAHEIARMDLNAELVVLSACETGFGRFENGNGIASLARSFMYAGTPSLLVSLWQVNDGATSILMQEFYANLAKGMSKDDALRAAKLFYIKRGKGIIGHPALWSPFVVIGSTDVVELGEKSKSPVPFVWVAGSLAILGLGLFGIWRKKTA